MIKYLSDWQLLLTHNVLVDVCACCNCIKNKGKSSYTRVRLGDENIKNKEEESAQSPVSTNFLTKI